MASHLVTQSNEAAEEARHRLHLGRWALLEPSLMGEGKGLCQEESVAILALLTGCLYSDWVIRFSGAL